MRRFVSGIASLFVLTTGVLIVFSPIDPVVWTPPHAVHATPRCDASAPELAARVFVSGLPGTPDGVARGPDGALYTALSTGKIARVDVSTGTLRIFGEAPGARLTGLAVAPDGAVFAADEVGGALFRFDSAGPLIARGEAVLHEANGRALQWTNDVTAAPDGAIYLTTSSQRRTLDHFYEEALEHRGSGQLIQFDPQTSQARVLQSALHMANGVALALDGLLVAESSAYSVRLFGLDGRAGAIVADNLPGFPGNIRAADQAGVYWLTLLSPRNRLIDQLASAPWARRLMAWLPAGVRPKPQPFHCLARITLGDRAPQLQAFRVMGPADMPSLSTALEVDGMLYVTPAGLGGVERGDIYAIDLSGVAP